MIIIICNSIVGLKGSWFRNTNLLSKQTIHKTYETTWRKPNYLIPPITISFWKAHKMNFGQSNFFNIYLCDFTFSHKFGYILGDIYYMLYLY